MVKLKKVKEDKSSFTEALAEVKKRFISSTPPSMLNEAKASFRPSILQVKSRYMKRQKTRKIFNYQIIIYPDKTVESNKFCFTAYCPVLEIADSGKTIEESFENIKGLIKFHLECLKREKSLIPQDFLGNKEEVITTAKVSVSV